MLGLAALLAPAALALFFGFFAFRSRIKGVYFSIITQALTVAQIAVIGHEARRAARRQRRRARRLRQKSAVEREISFQGAQLHRSGIRAAARRNFSP